MKPSTRLRFLVSLLALGLLAAACGGSSDTSSADHELATLQNEVAVDEEAALTAPAAAAGEEEAVTFEDAQLNFAACMRETYPEWPDPDPDENGRIFNREALEELDIDFEDTEFRDLIQECQGEFQGAGPGGQELSPEEQAEREDNLLALFACLRESPGYEDLPDPDFSAQGFGIRELFQGGDIDPQEFRGLMQDCAADLGIEAGPGGGGGAGRPGAGQGANRPAA